MRAAFLTHDLPLAALSYYFSYWLRGGLVVSVLDCQGRGLGFKSQPGQTFGSRYLLHLCPLGNSAMMSTLTVHCQWEDETVREWTARPSSYTEAKKMKLLALHIHGCYSDVTS